MSMKVACFIISMARNYVHLLLLERWIEKLSFVVTQQTFHRSMRRADIMRLLHSQFFVTQQVVTIRANWCQNWQALLLAFVCAYCCFTLSLHNAWVICDTSRLRKLSANLVGGAMLCRFKTLTVLLLVIMRRLFAFLSAVIILSQKLVKAICALWAQWIQRLALMWDLFVLFTLVFHLELTWIPSTAKILALAGPLR